MKSAAVVKVSGAKSVSSLTHYNEQEYKTSGIWKNDDHIYSQEELISFYGSSDTPQKNLKQQTSTFIKNTRIGLKVYQLLNKSHAVSKHKAYTIIQSFDYQANPDLRPEEVHALGEQYLRKICKYMMDNYNYLITDGMISTHIDRSSVQTKRKPVVKNQQVLNVQDVVVPHLHNHIIIPAFNSKGEPISKYLRKEDIYALQTLNDDLCVENNLNDYYFSKLHQSIDPQSSFSRKKDTLTKSNLQKAYVRFTKANKRAWMGRGKFKQSLKKRNELLLKEYRLSFRYVKDPKNNRLKKQFTMIDFVNDKHQQMWYNVKNLKLLYWENEPESIVEQIIQHLDFSGTNDIYMNNRQYHELMIKAIQSSNKQKDPVKLKSLYVNTLRQRRAMYYKSTAIQKRNNIKNRSKNFSRRLNNLPDLNIPKNKYVNHSYLSKYLEDLYDIYENVIPKSIKKTDNIKYDPRNKALGKKIHTRETYNPHRIKPNSKQNFERYH